MRPLTLLLDALAVYRLTRLVVADTITQPLRDRLSMTDNGDVREWLETLLTCRWCVGIHIGALVTLARWTIPTQWNIVAYGLAIASVAPLLARLEPQDD